MEVIRVAATAWGIFCLVACVLGVILLVFGGSPRGGEWERRSVLQLMLSIMLTGVCGAWLVYAGLADVL